MLQYLHKTSNIRTFLCLLCLLCSVVASAQVKDKGVPLINNYRKDGYRAGTQNWSVTQDNRGFMYFGNNFGVLEFDGTNWQTYPLPNGSIVRSVATDANGKIFVAGYNDFGVLKPDSKGSLYYFSFLDMVPAAQRNFGEVWRIIANNDGVYFQSFTHIFLYQDNKIKVVAENANMQFMFWVNLKLWACDKTIGLQEYRNGTAVNVKGGEIFSGDNVAWAMLPFDERTILIATEHNGLYLFDENGIVSWNVEASDWLKTYQVFSGTTIGGTYFVFGTIQSGIIIIDKLGRVIQHINRSRGLQNNTILSLSTDKDGNLWAGLDNGIAMIETQSSFSYYNEGIGIEGAGYASVVYKNNLYFGTNQGLFVKPWNQNQANFELVNNTKGQVWNLSIIDSTLFCGHNYGTYIVQGKNAVKISDIQGGWAYIKVNDNSVIGGNYDGLVLYQKDKNNRWSFVQRIAGFNESCREMCLMPDNILWMSHGYKGVYKIELANDFKSIVSFKLYTSKNGLPSDLSNSVNIFRNRLVVSTVQGLYVYNAATDNFEQATTLNTIFRNKPAYRIHEDNQQNIWFFYNSQAAMLKRINGEYTLFDAPFSVLQGKLNRSFEHILLNDNYNVIISCENGFLHYNPSISFDTASVFDLYIRRVSLSASDSIIFNGTFSDTIGNVLKQQPDNYSLSLNHKQNALMFDFSATSYQSPEKIQYRCKLQGLDKNWTSWSGESKKEYTNLPPRKYEFMVQAQNAYGQKSPIASYRFSITPPWYRTTNAYMGYILLGAALLYWLIRIIINRFEKQKQKLEQQQQAELKQREEEFIRQRLLDEQEIMRLKNEKLQAEIANQNAENELKNKELASVAMQINHKNEILEDVKKHIEEVSETMSPAVKKEIKVLIKKIDQDIELDKDWDRFTQHFDQVHADFFKKLQQRYPELTPKDLKLCAYLRMNLSTKEIAPLLNISIRGVEVSRYRLRRKLDLENNENLVEFMLNL